MRDHFYDYFWYSWQLLTVAHTSQNDLSKAIHDIYPKRRWPIILLCNFSNIPCRLQIVLLFADLARLLLFNVGATTKEQAYRHSWNRVL